MPKVIIWRDGAIETEFDPGHRDWRIGRSETNDITLIDPRKSVSRFHAELREEHDRWVFIDLNSQNGSWKDGQRLNRLTLEHGHEVLFGDYKLVFLDERTAAPAVSPLPPTAVSTGARGAGSATRPDRTRPMPDGIAGPPAPHVPPPPPPPPATAAPAPAPVPAAAPPPVGRPAGSLPAPRKGLNPLVILLALLVLFAMLGVLALVAYRFVTARADGPPVTDSAPVAEAPPADPAPPPPVDEMPAPAPSAEAVPALVGTPPGSSASVPPPVPPAASAPSPPTTPSASSGSRPKRAPAAPAPKEAPAVVARYEDGRRALNANRWSDAERAFQAVLAQQPNFRDAAALLARARQGQAAAREKALADAEALEASGDWARAIAAYERAGAGDQAAAARTRMQAAGDDAYRKARQFDARNRPAEATTWYGRAVEWLGDGDARKATAQERLAALKSGGGR